MISETGKTKESLLTPAMIAQESEALLLTFRFANPLYVVGFLSELEFLPASLSQSRQFLILDSLCFPFASVLRDVRFNQSFYSPQV